MEKAIENILKENNLKNTKGHFAVLEVLMKEKHPLTVEDINKNIKIKLNLTTLYRILEKFSDKRIIYQTTFLDGKSYFEYQHQHHHHITCKNCGVRNKIDFCVSNKINKIDLTKTNFNKISDHILEFFGMCNKCQKR